MAYSLTKTPSVKTYTREYKNLRGVDFSSLPSSVQTNRSPDALNVYKDYSSDLGQAIETRKGITLLGSIQPLDMTNNLLLNYSFSSGLDNWEKIRMNGTVNEGVFEGTATSTEGWLYQQTAISAEHKIYVRGKIKATSNLVKLYFLDGYDNSSISHSGGGDYEYLSLIHTTNVASEDGTAMCSDERLSDWDTIYVDEIIAFDLTDLYGAGNEPDKTIIDDLLELTSANIYGIHIFNSTNALIHCGNKLYIWSNFPSTPMTTADSGVTMAEAYSSSFMFDGNLYILDGASYFVYNGTSVSAVTGYIPTTSITAEYDGTNRVSYQAVNYISDYRKNDFLGDGSHATFALDVTSYDDVSPTATVNGSAATVSSYDYTAGTVTLSSAPADRSEVTITFKKTTSGYADYIKKCTIAKVFDNRVFVSGNPSYNGYLFHSELDSPTYFSDENWYDDGKDGVAITSLLKSADKLIVLKADVGEGTKVFYHTATYDSTDGMIYPVSETEVNLGGFVGMSFIDVPVFLSKLGLEYIYLNGESGTRVYHRSSFVDAKFINEINYTGAKMEVWRNYLCILVNGKMYLADSRQMSNYEYEWYYWEDIGVWKTDLSTLYKATVLREYDNQLYFGTDNGHICYFNGTCDTDTTGTGISIEGYWTTPPDIFNSLAYVKTTHKKGGVAQVKRIANSVVKIDVQTDVDVWVNIKDSIAAGLDFGDVDFANFSFGTGIRGYITFNAKQKRIMEFALKFYSDELNKPFGLYAATVEYEYSNYKK